MQESKFNFEEDNSKKDSVDQSKEAVKKDAKGLWQSIRSFFYELLDFRHDTDRDATIEAIKGDISFKGATAWILICSIFVASVGLNANSTAVVIGAMLISPLMGPILGVGMSIAINDIYSLRKSLINLAVMVVLSLLSAFLFFYLFPLNEETSELLGRTRPDIRDVLIAFFGGLALIIARTKKGTIASVIFGVAIATALMPPLCTAGYGLAVQNFEYFGGAMYLFTINTIFIGLATFLVLKLLRFPMLKYANSKKRTRISRLAMLLAIITMVPALFTFMTVFKESKINSDYNRFVSKEIKENPALWLQRDKLDPVNKKISLFFNGEITEATDADIRNELKNYPNIKDFDISIDGNITRSFDKMSEAYDRVADELDKKENIISGLQKEIEDLKLEIDKLNKEKQGGVSFSNLAKDAKIRFKDLEYFSYAKALESKDFIKVDTVFVAIVGWNTSLSDSLKVVNEKQLNDWLIQELKTSKVKIKRE